MGGIKFSPETRFFGGFHFDVIMPIAIDDTPQNSGGTVQPRKPLIPVTTGACGVVILGK